jgi:hypothetical protein
MDVGAIEGFAGHEVFEACVLAMRWMGVTLE